MNPRKLPKLVLYDSAVDKHVDTDGPPRSYAFLEFSSPNSVRAALELDGTRLRGRRVRIRIKRKNYPGFGRLRDRYGGYGPGRGASRYRW